MNKNFKEKEFIGYLTQFTQKAVVRDAMLGIGFYLAFGVWDMKIAPANYHTLWLVRVCVATFCLVVLVTHNHPFVKNYRRPIYLFCISVVLNSITVLWAFAYPSTLPSDVSLAAITLLFGMSAFHMMRKDAMLIGAIYILGFCCLLKLRNASDDIWSIYLVSLITAYFMGIVSSAIGESYLRRAHTSEGELRAETLRADSLLLKTFPAEVAADLKFTHRSKARRTEQVTVMFCDIVDFTTTSAQLDPEELVQSLNEIFSTFDRLTVEHRCEKIKTVGDAYMAVCGVPKPADNHADRIVRLAMALQHATSEMKLSGRKLKLRIGINSGPVVAGVIGESRFAYDLWGDTVNTASRMESLAAPGRIQMTEATRALLSIPVNLEKVSGLTVKGKGSMDTWLVMNASHPEEHCGDGEKAA